MPIFASDELLLHQTPYPQELIEKDEPMPDANDDLEEEESNSGLDEVESD